MPTLPKIDVAIRWLIRRDMQSILRIESSSFDFPWTDEDFLCCLRQRNCIGMVAEIVDTQQIVGYMVYELHKKKLHILNMAVCPNMRFAGIGRQMVDRLVRKLEQQQRNALLVMCREDNLDAQLFFRACDFRCVSTLKEACFDGRDGYVMEFKLFKSLYANNHPYASINRISESGMINNQVED